MSPEMQTQSTRGPSGYVPLVRSNPHSNVPIPTPTPGGGIAGFNPHKAQKCLFIDTTDKGQPRTLEVDLSQVTKEMMNEVMGNGVEVRQAPDNDVGGALAFAAMEKLSNRLKQPQPQYKQGSTSAKPVAVQMQPTGPPMMAPKQEIGGASMAVVNPPEHQVFFQIEGGGEMEAWYHDVVRHEDLLLLVVDRRFRGPKFLPPNLLEELCPHCGTAWSSEWATRGQEAVCPQCNASSAPPRPTRRRYLLVDVASQPDIIQAESLGLIVPFQHYELCLLPILRTKSKSGAPEDNG